MAYNRNERSWRKPSNRAKNYAEERRTKVHNRGKKVGQELTPYEAGLRSGYLQCQSDHAGMYKYVNAMKQGKTKQEALEISKKIGR